MLFRMRGWLAGLLLLLATADGVAAELRLAYADQDVPPYFLGNGPDIPARPGIVIDLVRQLLQQSDHSLILTRVPGRRLQDEIRAGRQDGLIGTRYTPDRAAVMAYPMLDGRPDPQRQVARVGYHLYARAESGIDWDGRRLHNLQTSLGIPAGVTALHLLPGVSGIPTVEAPTTAQLFNLLAFGRVDAVVTIGAVGDRYIGSFRGAEVVRISPPLLIEDFYIPFTRRFYDANSDFVEAFWLRLARDRDAVFRALLPEYGFSP
jgi:polar amino acid transport system substrate-binding protein